MPPLPAPATEAIVVLSFLLLQAAPQGNPLIQFLPLILIFGIFYFLLFMPMQRQKKAQQKMLAELQNGVTVVTSGGIIGTITGIDGDTLTLRIKPDNVRLQIARSAVSTVLNEEKK